MLAALALPAGSTVLDAGCGTGHVALHAARIGGLRVQAIDLTPHHIVKAQDEIRKAGLSDRVSARVGDYHDLRSFKDESLDGIYTMETLVHATQPRDVLAEFFRILKPGGRIVMHEYDHTPFSRTPQDFVDEALKLNSQVGMVAFETFETGDLKVLCKEAGFEDVDLVDMSENIVPMLWLFHLFAYVPHMILCLLGLQYYFLNTTSGVGMFKGRKYWRYVQVSGRKPA